MPWIGRKKLAFVPLFRPNAVPPDLMPPDWDQLILRRALFDPEPGTNMDRSLRAYIRTVSSGRADLDAVVLPMVTLDRQEVLPDALEGQLRATLNAGGFDAAAIVMLGGVGAGSAQGNWARFVMVERVGVWAMEFMHVLTKFQDLYLVGGNLGAFDEMACSCATHPTAYTKAAIGWGNIGAIARRDSVGTTLSYTLHATGLTQPPPSGRVSAVRIGNTVPYVMVEARLKVDQFDRGIPSEGVIVYRVQTADPLGKHTGVAPVMLLTPMALKVGQRHALNDRVAIRVDAAVPGGFGITVKVSPTAACAGILAKLREVEEALAEKPPPQQRKQLLQLRGQLRQQAAKNGCSGGDDR